MKDQENGSTVSTLVEVAASAPKEALDDQLLILEDYELIIGAYMKDGIWFHSCTCLQGKLS
eukprot:1151630-Pelagomonas_calceolata.AAC.5